MPNLATKDGTPTGGVYGFAMMAIKILQKFHPDYVAVAWDIPKTNIKRRVKLYSAYKANRKPAPPDFYEQIPFLHELLDAFGWPFYEVDDHEADDIMATFADQASEKGIKTILVTSDHDVFQLINEDVSVAILKKGLTNVEVFDADHFVNTYNMTPMQYVDYKALRGDPSDNIPGVAGVGDKTSRLLIDKYKSLGGVYEHIDEIKGSLQTKLKKDKDMAYLARKLIELDRNVPVKIDWSKADVNRFDAKTINTVLNKLEFKNLLRQLPANMQFKPDKTAVVKKAKSKQDASSKPETIFNTADLAKLELKPDNGLVVFIRTVGEHQTDMSHILLSDSPSRAVLIDLSGPIEPMQAAQKLRPWLEDKAVGKIGYDIKSDIKALMHYGVNMVSIKHDANIAAFLLDPLVRGQSLNSLATKLLGYEGENLDDLPPMSMQLVAPRLATVLWDLAEIQSKELKAFKKLDKLAREVDFAVIPVLAKMEFKGIKLDSEYLKQMSEEFADSISDLEQQIYGYANKEFNIASTQQLSTILFDELKLPTRGIKRTKSGLSTAASELEKLRDVHPIIDLLLRYRELAKLKSTYVDTLPSMADENNRVHTTFSLTTTQTGRLSSHNPNLQNIPVRTDLGRRIRRAFIADEGNVLISADYSQFELRLAAALSGDDDLIESFNDGLDIHTRTAAQIYGVAMDDVTKQQRRDAKVVNFGVLYGMSPHGLSEATGMDVNEAKEFIDKYFRLRKPLVDYIKKTRKKAEEVGYVETLFGRRRPTPDVKSSNYVVREAAYRQAVNMPIQGTEADLMKMAMIKIEKEVGNESSQLLQIHDSVLVECPEWKAKKLSKEIKDIMENIYKLPVHLDVDIEIGQNWGEL